MQTKNDNRILFLDYLRAVACLLVVFGHIYIIGFNYYEGIQPWVPSVKGLIFGPDAYLRNIFTWPVMNFAVLTGINVGALGVGIFFLISGFVILRAVERESTLRFVVSRIFRIYPVSLTCVFIAGALTAIYCAHTGTTSPNTLTSILASGFILNGFLHHFEATPVLWSLEVELMFYALMAAMSARGHLSERSILTAAVICAGYTYVSRSPFAAAVLPHSLFMIAVHLSFDSAHVAFLLVGSMIYRTATARAWSRLAWCALAVAVSCVARWAFEAEKVYGLGGVDYVNGFAGIGIFAAAMWSGMNWKWIMPLKWVADISYPLYLVHVPLGWICLAWLASLGLGMLSAGVITGALILLSAWAVHVLVEEPARMLGKGLSSARNAAATGSVAKS
ncbi:MULTISPECIES: acyltransferase [unclassified Paraburkholderia]|uniref:acyltransferase family protein n=1 Tax=unclassified Paraburkholderia TaxID=2615204 RepID=UPI0016126501|nr:MULTISPECIES: acyltransferase [unclassified Paraburkholderia]MBB5444662.1 peptidoglycan/LPS O-acetylase OafA/YrhL [Paraburkholderia sp. WSM4177]MBB5485487.1 peptidoglycan/LPS O-acetylase OafA/YrhL [Paraburkholderia sp. WSM4180]